MKANTYTKTIWLLLTVLACMLTYNPIYLTIILLILLAIAMRQQIEYSRYLKSGILFGILPLLVNVLFVHRGQTILLTIPSTLQIINLKIPLLLLTGPITLESVIFGAIMTLLLLDMLLAFGIYSSKISPDSLLSITPKFLFNSSLLIAIALRFTPIISDDLSSIADAQRSRGLNLSKGNLFQRILKHKALIIPSLVNSLERSFNLAEALAARAYSRKRTRFIQEPWHAVDYASLLTIASSLLILLISKANGLLEYWPYSKITPEFDLLPAVGLLLISIPVLQKWTQ